MTDKKETEQKKQVPVPRIIRLVSGEQLIAGITASTAAEFVQLVDPYKIDIFVIEPEPTNFWAEERMSLKPWCFQSSDSVIAVRKINILALAHPTQSMTDYYNNIKTGQFPPIRTGTTPSLRMEEKTELKKKIKKPEEEFNRLLDTMDDEDYGDLYDYFKGKRTIH